MGRLSKDEWAINLAKLTSQRSTCCRRAVGCVLLNSHGHVLATGYNGVASGQPHCNEESTRGVNYPPEDKNGVSIPRGVEVYYPNACDGAHASSGTNLDSCQAIHAEQNALLQCGDVFSIHTCYVTASPCMTCTKLLLNTSCRRIVYLEDYPHSNAEKLWRSTGLDWIKFNQC